MKPIHIAITDDNPKLIHSLKQNLAFFEEVKIVFTAIHGKDLLQKLSEYPLPEVILMDIEMPEINGIQATYEVSQRFGEKIKIIMLTVLEEEDKIFDAIQAGASGYLMKDEKPTRIINAIEEVIQGGVPMSMRVAQKTLGLLRQQKPMLSQTETSKPEQFNLTSREVEILQEIALGLS
ncbi:MAG: response regulator transcription factor, partial [Verrucomicrobia bacterium]|nr:response regulator transcription factor [Cytophagales bacterium]